MNGLLLSFEGLDGCGKSTQLERAKSWLEARGMAVSTYREPGGSAIGEAIRALLLNPAHTAMAGETELLLYTAARVQLLKERVLPDLESGRVVLLDRFADSTTAYQGYGRRLNLDLVESLNAQVRALAWPLVTLWLDLPMETALSRCAGEDRLEQSGQDFFQRVAAGYATLAAREPDRVRRVDATGGADDVFLRIEVELNRLVEGRKDGA
jgi:dTMP kinase